MTTKEELLEFVKDNFKPNEVEYRNPDRLIGEFIRMLNDLKK